MCGWHGRRCVGEPEMENEELERSVSHLERCFPLVTFLHANEIVPAAQIELGEYVCVPETIQKVIDSWQWIPIFLGDLIESSIVHTKAERTVFLLYEENRRTSWRLRRSDESLIGIFFQEVTQRRQFDFGKSVYRSKRDGGFGFEINGMVVGPMRRKLVSFGL